MCEEKMDLLLSKAAFNKKYQRNKQVATLTLGCKTNQYETDAMLELFSKSGYEDVSFNESADVYLINTCTVTHVGDKKSRQMIRRAKKINPNSLVVVMGCYAQISTEEVSNIPDVDIIIGTNARKLMMSYIERFVRDETSKPYVVVEDIMAVETFEDLSIESHTTKTRAFIKIQEGCNQYCSYCIIPYARGQVRSRPLGQIVDEIKSLSQSGYREFVLTGIHIGSYGLDLKDVSLIDCIEAVDHLPEVERVRLGSIEPRLITDAFVARIINCNKVCPHFHLSLQSGSDNVLKRMNRKYDTQLFTDAVNKLRIIYDRPSITTDIIVGFPGETDEAFEETLRFVEKIKPSEIHVFPYSKRDGTPAAKMMDQVPAEVKKSRSERLIKEAEKLKDTYMKTFMGETVEVILEEKTNDVCQGHSRNYMTVYWSFVGDEEVGKTYLVKVTAMDHQDLHGLRAPL